MNMKEKSKAKYTPIGLLWDIVETVKEQLHFLHQASGHRREMEKAAECNEAIWSTRTLQNGGTCFWHLL